MLGGREKGRRRGRGAERCIVLGLTARSCGGEGGGAGRGDPTYSGSLGIALALLHSSFLALARTSVLDPSTFLSETTSTATPSSSCQPANASLVPSTESFSKTRTLTRSNCSAARRIAATVAPDSLSTSLAAPITTSLGSPPPPPPEAAAASVSTAAFISCRSRKRARRVARESRERKNTARVRRVDGRERRREDWDGGERGGCAGEAEAGELLI